MDIAQAKTEFVARASLIVAPAFAKKATADMPTSVGKLVEWFMTADYKKLQPFKFDNNWEVASTVAGCQDNSKGLKLTCGYIEFKSEDVEYPMAIRPVNSKYVLLNSAISENRAGKVAWEMLMLYKDKYILANFKALADKAIRFNTELNGILQFEIAGTKGLYIPHTNYHGDKPPTLVSGIMVFTDASPKEAYDIRTTSVACMGPYYLRPGINPLIANAKSEVEVAYSKQTCKLVEVLYVSGKAERDTENKKTMAAFHEAIKGMNFVPDDDSGVRNRNGSPYPYDVRRAAASQLQLCWHPKSPVKFLGLVPPDVSISANESSYRLTATAMARSGGKLYATGVIDVNGNDWYSFKKHDVKDVWYEVTKMPGVTGKLTHEEE